ncbi:hypothetical protein AB1285_23560 [Microbacterium sp. NRRL B-14842]|uniref:alpha/beta fold hydrolase n=1 Tax=Microbacterium sp. NRRL B-14842 TaxID=3162881 RepID=UPI003D2B0E6D
MRCSPEAATGSGLTTFGDWQRDQVRPLRLRTDYRDRLAEIRVPVLLVHGDRDSGVPLRRIEEAADALRPAGSWWHREPDTGCNATAPTS